MSRTKKLLSIGLLFILVGVQFLPFSVVLGQVAGLGVWSPPEFLGDGWWQSVEVDRTGTAHIGWYDVIRPPGVTTSTDDKDLLAYVQRSLDGEWTEQTDIYFTGEGGFTVRNAFAVTSDGQIGAYFRGGPRHFFGSSFVENATSAANWNERQVLAGGYYLDMVVDSDNVFHIVTSGRALTGSEVAEDADANQETEVCIGCADLIYRRSVDRGRNWSVPFNLTDNKRNGADKPDLWIGPSGRLYANWDVGFDWYAGRGRPEGVAMRYSDDGGVTWSDSVILLGHEENPFQKPMQGAFTELGSGTLMAVWRYSSGADASIYYQLSEDVGLNWTDPEPVPRITARHISETGLDDYELLTDHLGNAHLFAVANMPQAPTSSLIHMEYRQGNWRPGQIVFERVDNVCAEWPKAAVGPQNDIHLTWFTRSDPSRVEELNGCESTTANLDVYYAYRTATMPERMVQAFEATAVPPPTAVAVIQFDPTPTPYPTVEPIERLLVPTTSDVYAAQTLLAAVGVCVLFCGAVFAAHRFLR